MLIPSEWYRNLRCFIETCSLPLGIQHFRVITRMLGFFFIFFPDVNGTPLGYLQPLSLLRLNHSERMLMHEWMMVMTTMTMMLMMWVLLSL